MRAAVILLLCVLVAMAAAGGVPSGSYCGSYMFFIKGRIDFVSSTELDFNLDVGGKKTTCRKERFVVAPGGELTLPDKDNKGDCIGELIKDNDLDTLKIHFDGNKIHLDAGVGSVDLKHC
uniref:Uncharacterized protein n=1 Tax=Neobodo designis TaxID=312471 RepID=A0A7S1PPY1_NEODS|eukprot:CAMPEP_0174853820 /NCGR_PEP_ID=MMETSP1114-20130205/29588_1 /TAXON_ID=312471 /ORGANISM="Neobodo designis, Strain CCAP 1951/1" /LENGTH=119 /DNA_ID=CAMNT_0016088487 /DNA_START=42 /DNA_END=401 /DNA_ORIENTATION=+